MAQEAIFKKGEKAGGGYPARVVIRFLGVASPAARWGLVIRVRVVIRTLRIHERNFLHNVDRRSNGDVSTQRSERRGVNGKHNINFIHNK